MEAGRRAEMPSTHHCTCQPRIQIENRQAKNRKREQDPARKAAVKAWCKDKLCSCGCGQPANCAHHPSDNLYDDEWANLDECEPWYSRCHHLHHKGLARCPSCGGWMRAGNEKCAKCQGHRVHNTKMGYVRHPCGKNFGRQRCTERIVCRRSPAKAEGCDYFIPRKAVA